MSAPYQPHQSLVIWDDVVTYDAAKVSRIFCLDRFARYTCHLPKGHDGDHQDTACAPGYKTYWRYE